MGEGPRKQSNHPVVPGLPKDTHTFYLRPTASPSSAMPRSRASLEPLSSPLPSLPPPKQRATPPPQSSHDFAGLDSGSGLSEPNEGGRGSAVTTSWADVRKQPTRRTQRGLIPDQMWGWYKQSLRGKIQSLRIPRFPHPRRSSCRPRSLPLSPQ